MGLGEERGKTDTVSSLRKSFLSRGPDGLTRNQSADTVTRI